MQKQSKGSSPLAWIWLLIGALYMFIPLYATLKFSLFGPKNVFSLQAYSNVLGAPDFTESFMFSMQASAFVILFSILRVPNSVRGIALRSRCLARSLRFSSPWVGAWRSRGLGAP